MKIYNTLTRQKQEFEPIQPDNVGLYCCGPTVYNYAHIGNLRTYIFEDFLRRTLEFNGYIVKHVMNITDVGHLTSDADEGEDKISKKARLEHLEPMEIVQKYTNGFHELTNIFNMHPPSIEPSATGHIVEQIEMTQTLLDKGLAYETNGSVYFDVAKYNKDHNYGKLSGRNIEDMMESGRALSSQDEKQNTME